MRASTGILAFLLVGGCAAQQPRDAWEDWYEPAGTYDVAEPVAFTDVNYDFTGPTPIAELPAPEDFQTWFAREDAPADGDCQDWDTTDELPAEITGIVTLHPRFYYKTSGCQPNQDVDSDQKYYGSYFVQDASGGFFVLGDSKVAHFDMGDRVTLRVRAIKESFDQLMIAVHDVVAVERGPEPIYFEAVDGELGPEHVARVVRIEGTVSSEMSTFGEVYLEGDDGSQFKMGLDAELNRRGVYWPPGTRLQVTGPVLYSFSEYTITVMRVGQVTEL